MPASIVGELRAFLNSMLDTFLALDAFKEAANKRLIRLEERTMNPKQQTLPVMASTHGADYGISAAETGFIHIVTATAPITATLESQPDTFLWVFNVGTDDVAIDGGAGVIKTIAAGENGMVACDAAGDWSSSSVTP